MAPRFAGTPVAPSAKPRFAGVPLDAAPAAEPVRTMPNLTGVPGFGPMLGMLGYDGRVAPEGSSMVPALDPINAAGAKLAESVPIVGPGLAEAGRNVDAAFATAVEGRPVTPAERQAITTQEQENFPVATMAGQAAGIVLPLSALGATKYGGYALGQTGNLATRVGAGLVSGAALSWGDALARGATTEEAMNAGLIGGALGGSAPLVAKGASMLWDGFKGALRGAAGGVDDVASTGLKSVASDMFRQSDAAGVAIDPVAYDRFLNSVRATLQKGRVNATLSPDTMAVLDELVAVGDDLANTGRGITLGEMHDLRQIANEIASSPKSRDRVLGPAIVERLDEFLDGLTPADIGGGIDPAKAVDTLQTAIGTWHVAKKAQMVEEAIYQAQNAASGFENGLRTQFRSLLKPANRKNFTADEIAMIEEVANGSVGANLLRLLGKFGFGGGSASNMLGGTIGTTLATTVGGPAAGLVAGGGASVARMGAEKMTGTAALNALSSITSKAPVNALGRGPSPSLLRALAQMNGAPAKLPFNVSPAVTGYALGSPAVSR